MRVLVTGGAGFIGSHLVDALVEKGHDVRIYDCLHPQVHEEGKRPSYLNPKAEFVQGNVCDYHALRRVLNGVSVVFHFAAAVGVGQSQYEIRRYVNTNVLGTANLLDILANYKHHVRKLVVAGSMSEYGEGLYECAICGEIKPPLRSEDQLQRNEWELHCPKCNSMIRPLPTREDVSLDTNSIYASTKKTQEEMALIFGKTYGMPVVSLRLFNVYGPRQSLTNPYTGVCAIFMSRIKSGNPPVVYEDGLQTRDFVSVHDVVRACLLVIEREDISGQVLNIGSGTSTSIRKVGEVLLELFGSDLGLEIAGKYRRGDVRHCTADITRAKTLLAYQPRVSFMDGMKEFIEWSREAHAIDRFEHAAAELREHGLV